MRIQGVSSTLPPNHSTTGGSQMTARHSTLTQERLKEVLHYDSGTGIFTWIKKKKGRRVGAKKSKHGNSRGYLLIGISGKNYAAHRLAWLYVHGKMPLAQIDHIDHVRSNNSIDNLREVTAKTNSRNSKIHINNKSGMSGVHWCKSKEKWAVTICGGGSKVWGGRFDDYFEAVCRRKSLELEYGFHETHGYA